MVVQGTLDSKSSYTLLSLVRVITDSFGGAYSDGCSHICTIVINSGRCCGLLVSWGVVVASFKEGSRGWRRRWQRKLRSRACRGNFSCCTCADSRFPVVWEMSWYPLSPVSAVAESPSPFEQRDSCEPLSIDTFIYGVLGRRVGPSREDSCGEPLTKALVWRKT
eukprot:1259758-Ditylum_brightwellii.AAC.1